MGSNIYMRMQMGPQSNCMKSLALLKLTFAGNIERYGAENGLNKPLQPPVDKVPSPLGSDFTILLL